MSSEAPKNKDRSPNFPFIALEVALQRAQQFFAKEKRGAAPFKAAVGHWNYSPNSSGGIQTVAALKSYGLMSDEGSGAQRTVRLTELALRILLDPRPDSSERAGYIKEAAMSPSVAREVYAKWDDELPSEASLLHFLILDRSFNDSTAHKVSKIIFSNHAFAGIDSSSRSPHESDMDEDINQSGPSAPTPATPPTSGRFQATAPVSRGLKEERIIAPDADIIIQFSGDPTYATYDFLENYVKLRKSVLKPKAHGGPEE